MSLDALRAGLPVEFLDEFPHGFLYGFLYGDSAVSRIVARRGEKAVIFPRLARGRPVAWQKEGRVAWSVVCALWVVLRVDWECSVALGGPCACWGVWPVAPPSV